jgi:TonB family protein
LRSSHADFLAAAFAAVEQWEFQPARYGRVPAPGAQLAVLSFHVVDEETNAPAKEGWLEKNGITIRDAHDSRSADYFTRIPEAVIMVDPVYPHPQLTGGVEGTAQVFFSVNEEGRVNSVRVAEAADPDFGASLVAAISAWRFKPLYHHGEAAAVDFALKWKFSLPTGADTDPESLAALNPDAPRAKARELDRPLFPLYRRAPQYPAALFEAKTAGAAEIEVTINKSGRVCWPRIVSATQPEFGWAAATAVSQWYFETPLKGGQPVAVRVVIPVRFAATE